MLATLEPTCRRQSEIVHPPPARTPDQWADSCRVLMPPAAEPGPFRSSRTPYTIEPLRALCDPEVDGVVWIGPAQCGKTDMLLSAIGHRADDDPTPQLYIGPTREIVENEFSPRLSSMIRSTPSLLGKLAGGKQERKNRKVISGVPIRLGWAGSAAQLVAFAAGRCYLDERDQAEESLAGQGDPLEMIRARGRTFPDFHFAVVGTITNGSVEPQRDERTGLEHWAVSAREDVPSPTWRLWQQGTRHEWAWPCPECERYFVPRLKLLWWPKGCEPDDALEAARLVCPHCAARIADDHRDEMNARAVYCSPGESVERGRVVGKGVRSAIRTYWVSGLASAWMSFGRLARDWLLALRSGDQERLQGVVNLGFAELYSIKGEAPDWSEVKSRCVRHYQLGEVPSEAVALVCSVDVQKRRLIYEIRAWGRGMASWLVRFEEIHGETEHDLVWHDLARIITTPIGEHSIRVTVVDAGFRPGDRYARPVNQVYAFCRRMGASVRPTKGQATQEKPLRPSMIDVVVAGRATKRPLQLWHLDTDYFKQWVHARLRWPDDQPGGWYVPEDVTDDYLQQITSEARLTTPTGAARWHRIRRENHAFDTAAMSVAGATMLGLHTVAAAGTAPVGDATAPRGRRVISSGVRPD